MRVLVLVGSSHAGSLNARLARAALAHLPEGTEVEWFTGLADLPHYEPALDGDEPPAVAVRLRAALQAADALLLATSEYNGSLPSSLKNAIDWASRPREAAPLTGLPCAVIGATTTGYAAEWARADAVRILTSAKAAPLPHTVGLGHAQDTLAGDRVLDPVTAEALAALMADLQSARRES